MNCLGAGFDSLNTHELHISNNFLFSNNEVRARRPVAPISKIYDRSIVEANGALIGTSQVIAPSFFEVGGYFRLNNFQVLESILGGNPREPLII